MDSFGPAQGRPPLPPKAPLGRKLVGPESGTTKALFVPLRTEFFRAFERGEKQIEYRAYGPRWNGRTCWPGRPVTLSHGYSGARLRAVVERVDVVLAEDYGSTIYSPGTRVIRIHLRDIG